MFDLVYVVRAAQVIGGVLLVNRYVPLGMTILAPVIVNILAYQLRMDLYSTYARPDMLGAG